MKIIRTITYEGTEEQLRKQMQNSLADGTYNYLTTITVSTRVTDGEYTGQRTSGWNEKLAIEEGRL